jgi:hypothetical protein
MTDTTRPPVNRNLLIGLAGVAAAGAAAMLYLFVVAPLLLGEEVADATVPVAQPVQTAGEDADADAESVEAEEAEPPLPETFEVFTARDPFQQLVQDTEAGATDGGGGGATATQVSTQPTGGTGGSGGTGEEPVTDGPSGTRVGTTVIRIVEVTTTDGVARASITVNGTGYTVAEGEVFATSFRVLDITGDCATLLFGDSRFTLCAGEEIRK